MAEIDVAKIADEAIGLFIEELDRRGIDIESPVGVDAARAAAVIEVVEGVEADVPS